jgi:WD40 repeat protein
MLPLPLCGFLFVWLALALILAARGQPPAQEEPPIDPDQLLVRQALRVFSADGTWTHSIAFAPDGKSLAAGYVTKAYLWDLASGKERFVWPVPRWTATVAFAPDAEFLAGGGSGATQGAEQTITLWDTATGKALRHLGPPGAQDVFFTIDRDGRRLHLAGRNYLESWDVLTGKKLTHIDLDEGFLTAGFSPDGKTIALYGDTSSLPDHIADKVVLRDLASGKELRRFGRSKGRTTRYAQPVFTADGKTVAIFLNDNLAHLYDVASGKELRTFGQGAGPVAPGVAGKGYPFLAFSRDGKYLAGGDVRTERGAAFVWEVATGKELRRFQFKYTPFMAAAFAPDGKTVALATAGGVFVFGLDRSAPPATRRAAPGEKDPPGRSGGAPVPD